MKNTFIIIALSFFSIQLSLAQYGSTTVKLRNGSIVTGKLIKSKDGSRMKIETPNGSVIFFTEKAVKEIIEDNDDDFPVVKNSSSRYNNLYDEEEELDNYGTKTNSGNRSSGYSDPRKKNNQQKRTTSAYDILGYRGFVDIGYTIGLGDYSYGRFELTTSHGYQINPYLFIGGGTGMHYYKLENFTEEILGVETSVKSTLIAIPIFADIRANFIEKGPIIPFAGLKAGYSIGIAKTKTKVAGISESISDTEGLGFYLSPSIGAKYMISPSMALNLSLGYTIQLSKVFDPSIEINGSDINIEGEKTKNLGGFGFKVGFEF